MARGPRESRHLRTPRRRAVDADRRDALVERISLVLLNEGFTSITVDDLARRLRCSKATLYTIAPTKSQLVVTITKRFFEEATREIEEAIGSEGDPAERISAYLKGVGRAMSRQSAAFYQDMVAYQPTAEIYDINSMAAARRTQELIREGVRSGRFRDMDANFAGHLVALAIEGIQSGRLQDASGLSAGQAYSELGELLVKGLGHAQS